MGIAILKITNGTTSVNLIKNEGETGFHLIEWEPAVAEPKGGGVWSDSPLSDSRRMVMRRWSTVIEIMTLSLNGFSQEAVIRETQDLRRLLEQARDYWKPRATVGPVWIEASADCESEIRYAYIHDYRTPSDNNPYGTGFGGVLPMMSGWQLLLERGHWQEAAPGGAECVELSSPIDLSTYGANLVANPGFETAGGGGADVFASWTETASDGAITRDLVTFFEGVASAKLVAGETADTRIQQNVAVVAGSTYLFDFRYRYTSSDMFARPRFQVLNVTAGGNIIPITELPASFSTTGWRAYQVRITIPAGCVSAGIVFWCNGDKTGASYFDLVRLSLVTADLSGPGPTCERQIYIPNSTRQAQLTHVYRYDASAVSFSANLINAARPFDLLPSPAAAGDILYLGCQSTGPNYGPFANVILDLTHADIGFLDGIWEIWTGAAWAAVAVVDNTSYPYPTVHYGHPLLRVGSAFVTIQNFTGWATNAVNGVTGWWLRLRVTAIVAGNPRPQQQNGPVYSAIKPWAELAAGEVPGDLPALARAEINMVDLQSPFSSLRMLIATRSVERGERFNPYLNVASNQQPNEIYLADNSDPAATMDYDPAAPTGWAATLTNNMNAEYYELTIGAPLCDHYHGAFRLLARVKQMSGTAGTIPVSIDVISNRTYTTPRLTIPGSAQGDLLDFGRVLLPAAKLTRGETLEKISFRIVMPDLFPLMVIPAGTVRFYDLILVPTDETVLEMPYTADNISRPSTVNYLYADSLLPERMLYSGIARSSDGAAKPGTWVNAIASSPFTLAPARAQRLYLFSLDRSNTFGLAYPTLERMARYLSMRGDR